VAICGAAGATLAAAVALGSSQLLGPPRPSLRAAARHIASHAPDSAVRHTDTQVAAIRQLHRSLVQLHRAAGATKTRKQSRILIHHTVRHAPAESVVYKAAPANQPAASAESVSYQAPTTTAESPPQQSQSATTASAGGSQASSASAPAAPSPTGALTCISNCG
jgi:hypothetical protein